MNGACSVYFVFILRGLDYCKTSLRIQKIPFFARCIGRFRFCEKKNTTKVKGSALAHLPSVSVISFLLNELWVNWAPQVFRCDLNYSIRSAVIPKTPYRPMWLCFSFNFCNYLRVLEYYFNPILVFVDSFYLCEIWYFPRNRLILFGEKVPFRIKLFV